MEPGILTGFQKLWQVRTERPVSYDIICSHDLFHPDNDALLVAGDDRGGQRRFVVVDSQILLHYGDAIENYFQANNIDARIHSFEAGEHNKSVSQYLAVLESLDAFPINRRNEPIIAIGGGVVTDLVGFVASSWRRGVPHINVPTTLMGYVDAAIGVKTGINFKQHKNRLGSFSSPERVLLDHTFFQTLPHRHLLNGVGEILKLAIVKEPDLFSTLELHGSDCISAQFQDKTSWEILSTSVESMLAELVPNLFETELARVVDFGHTFSTALEMQDNLDLLHGEAVVIDMLLSSIIAWQRSLLSRSDLDRIFSLVLTLKLPLSSEGLQPDLLMQSLMERQHHRNGVQRVPLPMGIGSYCFAANIGLEDVTRAVIFFKGWLQDNYYGDGIQNHERIFQRRR
jgi:3-dehydroquinate synthase